MFITLIARGGLEKLKTRGGAVKEKACVSEEIMITIKRGCEIREESSDR